jgi:hypothetical protein
VAREPSRFVEGSLQLDDTKQFSVSVGREVGGGGCHGGGKGP